MVASGSARPSGELASTDRSRAVYAASDQSVKSPQPGPGVPYQTAHRPHLPAGEHHRSGVGRASTHGRMKIGFTADVPHPSGPEDWAALTGRRAAEAWADEGTNR